MGFDPVDADILCQRAGLTADVLSAMLCALKWPVGWKPCPAAAINARPEHQASIRTYPRLDSRGNVYKARAKPGAPPRTTR